MPLNPSYVSKTPDENGLYSYTDEENSVWAELFSAQVEYLKSRASNAFLEGISALALTASAVPQVREVDARLASLTGAGVEGVPALIPQDAFSKLLSQRKFPVATFIRRREDMEYLEEPDIFHEVFGHAPMLTNEAFCTFLEKFGALALTLSPERCKILFRLFWFTVEFGLVTEDRRAKPFGAGIMSSPAEAAHASSTQALVLPFDPVTVMRTPYRIDIVQPVYFRIDSFDELAACTTDGIMEAMNEAVALGDLPARFEQAA